MTDRDVHSSELIDGIAFKNGMNQVRGSKTVFYHMTDEKPYRDPNTPDTPVGWVPFFEYVAVRP